MTAERDTVSLRDKLMQQQVPRTNGSAQLAVSAGKLRLAMDEAMTEQGCSLGDLTVLATQNDPFRNDTPAGHRDGAWLAVTAAELGLGERRIHLRGLHYMVIGMPKPNGQPYTNTDPDWLWLSTVAGKAARWLGYIPFDQIVDARNAAPEVQLFERPEPWAYVSVGLDVQIPDVDELEPRVDIEDFTGVQPYKLVLIGEKSSLHDALHPLAGRYQADLYLPTGEPSDTMLHQMASIGAGDGRPMRVLYFSDADPSGWQMPISVGRKLQALKVLLYPELQFELYRVALTPDQVREYELPSTPLKATERRADKWRTAMRVEQTEIDALASLRPELLTEIARSALDQFFDRTLDVRVMQAYGHWLDEAQAVVDEQTDGPQRDAFRAAAHTKLDTMRREIDTLNDAMRIDVGDFDLPEVVIPAAVTNGHHGMPLLSSQWSFGEQCRRLTESKSYLTTTPKEIT